ncbi:MAG: 50S ribosomal protein L23 [Pseudomonadota bacterium]
MASKKAEKVKGKPEFKEAFYNIIRRPVITEKATAASEQNKVIFLISPDATKAQVKEAVEGLFKVDVVSVNTLNVKGKKRVFRGVNGQCKDRKKAVVTLASGQSIDLSSGVA